MSDAVENAKNAIENDNYEEALKIARKRHSKDDVESYITILDLLIETGFVIGFILLRYCCSENAGDKPSPCNTESTV